MALLLSLLLAQPAAAAVGAGFEVRRYAVALRPDVAAASVSGTETIEIRSTSAGLTQVAFSPNALRISAASVDGVAIAVHSGKDGHIFVLPRPLANGRTATLRFAMVGTPARGVTTVPGGIYTSYFACDWMVCLQDAPGDKADLALDLLIPAGMTSLGVGQALPVQARADGLVLHRWRSTRAYSPYVYGFAAGPFVRRSVATGQGELVYLDATGARLDLAGLFDQSPAIAAFLAEKAGMPLPDRRYTQLLVPGREAQEAAGFSLVGSEELERERADPASAWVIVHEMAHQYWGNLVTCATWRDFWLNEGIATFMTAAWAERQFGAEGYARELGVARGRLEKARAAGFDKPLAWDGKYPSLAMRRAVQYSKGALFLAHLRETIGDAAFWAGLRDFTRRHAGGTVTSRDFEMAMARASKRDLSALFAEWVYGR